MVRDFRLDRFEITVGRFRQFMASYPMNKPAAGAGAHPLIDELHELVRGVCVLRVGRWAVGGGRLATEAEWNYAAAGGNEQRQYPWGAAAPDTAHAVYDCTGDGPASGQCAATDILNVGAKSTVGDGKWGQADLAGGVAEWTLDWYGDPYAILCNDCAIVSQGTASYRVIRGGSWSSVASLLLSSVRLYGDPTGHSNGVGARCARTP